jgi:micrococcal nuclease
MAARRFRRRPLTGLAVIAILVVLILLDRRGWLLVARADDLASLDGAITMVTRVIDGDTIEVGLPDARNDRSTTRVRLWGIDCPEAARPGRAAEPLAADATALVRRLVEGRLVRLELEPRQVRDSFGRVLAHVGLEDSTSLNARLLEAGLARADGRWPHTRLVQYGQLERRARREKIGLWTE